MIKLILKNKSRILALGLLTTVAGLATADEVRLAGSTLGSFNGGPFVPTQTILGLTYVSSTFDNTTVGGLLDFGGNPSPGVDFNNMGSFTLTNMDAVYTGQSFDLQVIFTAPTPLNGGQSAIFTDLIRGTVKGGLGGVFVDFENEPKTFTWANETSTGSFTMFVNDVSIAPGQSASVTAHVEGSQQPVPEPTVIAGLACGALGLLRRRKKA